MRGGPPLTMRHWRARSRSSAWAAASLRSCRSSSAASSFLRCPSSCTPGTAGPPRSASTGGMPGAVGPRREMTGMGTRLVFCSAGAGAEGRSVAPPSSTAGGQPGRMHLLRPESTSCNELSASGPLRKPRASDSEMNDVREGIAQRGEIRLRRDSTPSYGSGRKTVEWCSAARLQMRCDDGPLTLRIFAPTSAALKASAALGWSHLSGCTCGWR